MDEFSAQASSNYPIAFVLPSLAHGGAQKMFLEIAGYLAHKDMGGILILLDREGELLSQLPQKLDVIFLRVNKRLPLFLVRIVQWFTLRRVIYEKGIHHVFSTITGMNIFTLACFYFSKKIRVTIREATTLENNRSYLIRLLMRCFYRRADKVICTSEFIQSQLINMIGLKSKNVIFLPNPIDCERVRALALNAQEMQNVVSGRYMIVSVGRLIRAKGFDVLIDALLKARQSEDIVLIIVGDGPERHSLEQQVVKSGLTHCVKLVGYQRNPYPYMAAADLFILSSRWEGYVNTVVEAMVLGTDVIVTACNSGPGNLLKEKLGYPLVPVDSSAALADAIVERLRKPRDTAKFGELVTLHDIRFAAERYLGEVLAN